MCKSKQINEYVFGFLLVVLEGFGDVVSQLSQHLYREIVVLGQSYEVLDDNLC